MSAVVESYADVVSEYMRQIVEDEVQVGKNERLAVERFQADMEHAHERGWEFREDLAEAACNWFPKRLRHTVGKWAGSPFTLDPWQAFVVFNLIGWRSVETGLRRFRRCYICVGRKNGKSTLAAGIAVMLAFDDFPTEHGGEVYFTGPKYDQAEHCYRIAMKLIESSPYLRKRSKVHWKSCKVREPDCVIQPLSVGPAHGFNPSVIIRDELHEQGERHRHFSEALTSGGASREHPLEMTITTSGDPAGESPLWEEEDEYAEKILSRQIDAEAGDKLFCYIARYDKDDDWADPQNFRKGNPNLGISVFPEYLQDQLNEALHKPATRNRFLRYHCNRPTGSQEKAVQPEIWAAARAPREFKWKGRECYAGLDVGSTYDWSGFALVFPDEDVLHLRTWSWGCLEGRLKVQREPFTTWRQQGLLTLHEGSSVDFSMVEQDILGILEEVDCQSLAFDPHSARVLAQKLGEATGVELYEYPQSYVKYNEPVKQFVDRICKNGLLNNGNPCEAWQVDNLRIKRNTQDMWMPDKSHPSRKIDGIVAGIMALGEYLFVESVNYDYYDDNPVESF